VLLIFIVIPTYDVLEEEEEEEAFHVYVNMKSMLLTEMILSIFQ
jgi:hypothetical protein